MYTDETNMQPRQDQFLIYGGVAIPGKNLPEFSSDIDKIREDAGYGSSDLLKSNTRERPDSVTASAHAEIKGKVLDAAANCGAVMFAYFALHDIINDPATARKYGINELCYSFDCFLHWPCVDDHGFVLIDPFEDKGGGGIKSFLQEKFCTGVTGLPHSKEYRLKKMLGIHLAPVGSGHGCSLCDIAIGSLRYAINNRSNPEKMDTVEKLMTKLQPLMNPAAHAGRRDVLMINSPRSVKVQSYRQKYNELDAFLISCNISTDWSI